MAPNAATTNLIREMVPRDVGTVYGIEQRSSTQPLPLEMIRSAASEERGLVYTVRSLVRAFAIIGDAGTQPRQRVEVMHLAVYPDLRFQGIGTELLQVIVAGADGLLAGSVTADVPESNTVGLMFFRKNGFKPSVLLRKHFPNGDDAIRMVCDLTGRMAS